MLYNANMTLFDGKKESIILEQKLVKALPVSGELPMLAIIQIGNNSSSEKYIQLKVKLCDKLGIPSTVYHLSESISNSEIHKLVKDVYNDQKVGGGIIQLPLPRKSLQTVLALIPEKKDIDLLSPASQKEYYTGDFSRLPPVVKAVEHFIKVNEIDIKNMKVYVLGYGFLVGKPVAWYLQNKEANVSVIEDYQKGKTLGCQLAVLSAGVPNLVDGADLPEGCHVLDFGSSVVNGKIVGDLDMKSKVDHLGVVSASPGGMGPLVVRYLIENFITSLQ